MDWHSSSHAASTIRSSAVPSRHRGPAWAEGEVRQVLVAGLLLDAHPAWVYTGQHRDRMFEVANYGEPRTRTHQRPAHPGRHRGPLRGPGGRPDRPGHRLEEPAGRPRSNLCLPPTLVQSPEWDEPPSWGCPFGLSSTFSASDMYDSDATRSEPLRHLLPPFRVLALPGGDRCCCDNHPGLSLPPHALDQQRKVGAQLGVSKYRV
jgi:hypothetical protein